MELIITKDKADLERLEGIIHKNLQSFYEVGRALMEIRDKELYKIKNGGEYGTFEAYCRAVWDFTRIRAYQLIESVAVRENLLTQVNIEPKSEKQIRPLVKLKADQQREAWQRAVDTAPEGKVTASHVYKIVKEMTSEPEKQKTPAREPPPLQPRIPQYARQMVDIAISQLERIHDDDPTKEKEFDRLINWINQHRGKGKKNG
jgi:hypothetical protein